VDYPNEVLGPDHWLSSPVPPQGEKMVPSNENAVDHGNNPPDVPGAMDVSRDDEHVPKVSHRLTEYAADHLRVLNFSLPRPGAEAVHDHEAAGEVDRGGAQEVLGGPAVTRPRLAPHTRYVRVEMEPIWLIEEISSHSVICLLACAQST
jgi:hypothetical protein